MNKTQHLVTHTIRVAKATRRLESDISYYLSNLHSRLAGRALKASHQARLSAVAFWEASA